MNINETNTGCAQCPYYNNLGKCSWSKKCSHVLSITTNSDNNNIIITPIPYIDDNIVIINQIT